MTSRTITSGSAEGRDPSPGGGSSGMGTHVQSSGQRWSCLVLWTCFAFVIAGCGAAGPRAKLTAPPTSPGAHTSYQVVARSQRTNGRIVVIAKAILKSRGWVSVHADTNGAPGV